MLQQQDNDSDQLNILFVSYTSAIKKKTEKNGTKNQNNPLRKAGNNCGSKLQNAKRKRITLAAALRIAKCRTIRLDLTGLKELSPR